MFTCVYVSTCVHVAHLDFYDLDLLRVLCSLMNQLPIVLTSRTPRVLRPLQTESDSESADSEHTGTSSGASGEGTSRHARGSPAVEMEQSLVLAIREQCIELITNIFNFHFIDFECWSEINLQPLILLFMDYSFDIIDLFHQVAFSHFLLSFDANSTSLAPGCCLYLVLHIRVHVHSSSIDRAYEFQFNNNTLFAVTGCSTILQCHQSSTHISGSNAPNCSAPKLAVRRACTHRTSRMCRVRL